MKLVHLAAFVLCFVLIGGCTSIRTARGLSVFKSLAGSDVVTVRPTRLTLMTEEWSFLKNVPYELEDPNNSSDSPGDHWLAAGTKLHIERVNRYSTFETGPWIGVVGTVISPDHVRVTFYYRWPSHYVYLSRAAWEGEDVPVDRLFH